MAPLLHSTLGDEDWWFINGRLYDVNLVPIVAGAGQEQRMLGRMILGREMRRETILSSGDFGNSAFTFERDGHVLLSSLPQDVWQEFESALPRDATETGAERVFQVRGERWLASFVEFNGDHPVRLYTLQSFDQATAFLRALNRSLAMLGAIAVLGAALIVFLISRQITRPIEQLVIGAKRLQKGEFDFQIPIRGHDEVADLGRAFKEMRDSLKKSRESMLRAARLEAVGRLAGGVAHDFNNLVMIIKGYSDMLSRRQYPRRSVLNLRKSRTQVTAPAALTRQLLAFSRKQVLEPQILDPNQIVRNMIKMLRVLIGEDIELKHGSLGSDLAEFRRTRAARTGGDEPGRQCPRRHAAEESCSSRHSAAHLDERYAASNPDATPGRLCSDRRHRQRHRHGQGNARACLRTVLHHQGSREKAQASAWRPSTESSSRAGSHRRLQRSRSWLDVQGLPARRIWCSLGASADEESAASLKGTGTILLVEDEPAGSSDLRGILTNFRVHRDGSENGAECPCRSRNTRGKDRCRHSRYHHASGRRSRIDISPSQDPGSSPSSLSTGYTQAGAFDQTQLGDAILLQKPFTAETLAGKVQERLNTKASGAAAHLAIIFPVIFSLPAPLDAKYFVSIKSNAMTAPH